MGCCGNIQMCRNLFSRLTSVSLENLRTSGIETATKHTQISRSLLFLCALLGASSKGGDRAALVSGCCPACERILITIAVLFQFSIGALLITPPFPSTR
jgi:hypothetical protein